VGQSFEEVVKNSISALQREPKWLLLNLLGNKTTPEIFQVQFCFLWVRLYALVKSTCSTSKNWTSSSCTQNRMELSLPQNKDGSRTKIIKF